MGSLLIVLATVALVGLFVRFLVNTYGGDQAQIGYWDALGIPMGAKLVSRGVLWLVPISDLVTKLTVGLAVYVPVMALLFIVLGKVPPVRALLLALIAAIALSVVGVLLAVMVVPTKP